MKTIAHTFLFIVLYSFCFSPVISQISVDQAKKIDQLFSEYNDPSSPGCVVGVIDKGQFVYAKGFGMANIKQGIAFTPNTEFCIGSITKQFTATCIGLLALEGKIDLDEDIRTYLPELSNYDHGITVRHLLHHTSGIRDYSGLMSILGKKYKSFITYEETLPLLQKQKVLNFLPNTKRIYSNSGYLLAQEMVRRVSGQSLQSFAEEHIFASLGMRQTFYNSDFARITSDKTTSYTKDREGNFIPIIEQSAGVSNELIQTTLRDLLAWDQNFYHYKVGSEALSKMLQSPAILENGDTVNYGFGLELGNYLGVKFVTHGGSNLGYVSEFVRFPEQRKSIIVFSNGPFFNVYSMVFRIADIVLKDQLTEIRPETVPVPTIKLSNDSLKKYCGPYWNTQIDEPRYVYLKNDTIRYNRPDWYESPLVPIGNHSFKMLNSRDEQTASTVRFVLNESGKNELYLGTKNGAESLSYIFEEAKYRKKELSQFEGKYYSEEIDFTFEVTFMNKALNLITDTKKRYRLSPSKADYFKDRINRKIVFIRDEENNITGFTMDTTRVKKLFFQKVR